MTGAEIVPSIFAYIMAGLVVWVLRRTYLDLSERITDQDEERSTARLNLGVAIWPIYLVLLTLYWLLTVIKSTGRTFKVAFGKKDY